ncbi:MAG: ribonuclease HII [Candidatus Methylumidiphilus sp.]
MAAGGHGLLTVGIDEVGRGCLVGAVVAAAVILNPNKPISGLADSKKLTAARREELKAAIQEQALAWAIGRAEPSEIDRINILQASLLGMRRACAALSIAPEWAQVDGNHYPAGLPCPGVAIIKGDQSVAAISAASILAKVARDAEMAILDALYPGYQFAVHKGYPTALHKAKLAELGPTPAHRMSYAPVAWAASRYSPPV